MIPVSFDVSLLIMSTSAALPVTKTMHLFEICGPQMCNAITIGNNSSDATKVAICHTTSAYQVQRHTP